MTVQPRRWRHKKRGSTYVEVSREYAGRAADERRPESASPWSGIAGDFAKIQGRIHRGERVVFYRTETDGTLWCRAEREFMDGRFEELTPAPEVALAEVKAELEQKREECSLIENRLTDALAAKAELAAIRPPTPTFETTDTLDERRKKLAEANDEWLRRVNPHMADAVHFRQMVRDARIERLTAERDRLAEALKLANEWLSCVEPHLRDGPNFKRDHAQIRDVLFPDSLSTPEQPAEPSEAARDVLAERRRQVEVEGWSPEHDNAHDHGELARAAVCYADPFNEARENAPPKWPWDTVWWKPKGQRRDLVRAAALIIAEIERLDRASLAQTEPEKERRP